MLLNLFQKKGYRQEGSIPIIDQSQSYIAGYTDDNQAVPAKLPYIILGDHTRIIKYREEKFAQGGSGTKVFYIRDITIDPKYVYYAMRNINIKSRGYNRHWSVVKTIEIPIPPLEIQQQIVEQLDKFDTLVNSITEGLPKEIELRQKQYEYYRDKLLTFKEI